MADVVEISREGVNGSDRVSRSTRVMEEVVDDVLDRDRQGAKKRIR